MTENRQTTLVFAGNRKAAQQAARDAGLRDGEWEYVASERQLRGRSTGGLPRLFGYGIWDRWDWRELETTLRISDLLPAL